MDKKIEGDTQAKEAVQYKVIRTEDFTNMDNPSPGQRLLLKVLTEEDRAKHLGGIFSILPPAAPAAEPAYHYHKNRESIIQILSGDATEMVEGKAIPLKPGDVIFIPPNIKHTLLNSSSTGELKYIEFYSPPAPDSVQVK